jgi:hypothetical protein
MHLKFPLIASLSLLAGSVAAQDGPAAFKSAVPLDPIDTIIEAFSSYRVVALGEGAHGNEQSHAFRLSLLRDPRFADVVNDIVVEFGSGAYQDVIDRFIRGEEVATQELRQVWQNTAIEGTLWDRPVYEGFYRAVRDVNATRPREKQLRVLLGDGPLDWDRVNAWTDFAKHSRTDVFPAELVQREVIEKGRRALIIYGEGHFYRKRAFWQLKDPAAAEARFAKPLQSIVTLLENKGIRVFSIGTPLGVDWSTVQSDVANWAPPKLAHLSGTILGKQLYTRFYGGDMYIMVDDEKGIEERVVNDPNRTPSMEEQFDAVLYLGPRSTLTTSKLAPELCRDSEYMNMRLRRMRIGTPPGWTDLGVRLNEYCASIAPK